MIRSRRTRREAGLSQFDVVTAVGSVALLILVAGVPDASQDPALQLETAHGVVRDAFDLTRHLSLARGEAHGLAFDTDHERLAIVDAEGQLARLPDGVEPLIDLAELGVDLHTADFGQGGALIVLDPQGLPLSGGQLGLSVGAQDTVLQLDLRLDAATGHLARLD